MKTIAIVSALFFSGMSLHAAEPLLSTTLRLSELENKVAVLEDMINSLMQTSPSSIANLNCDTREYSELTPEGSNLILLALCEGVEPYLEGHKVFISVGNPYAVDFRNVSGTLLFGETFLDAIKQGGKAEVPITDDLRSGTWTRFQVILNPSKPSQLRSVSLRVAVKTVSLKKP